MTCPNCGTNNAEAAKYCQHCGKELAMAEHRPAVIVHPVPEPSARELPYAGFWRRVAATLIDTIPLAIMSWIVGSATKTHSMYWWNVEDVGDLRGFVLGAILGWLYYALSESSGAQATLGKMTMGLYVTDENGRRISFGRATGRHFGKYISGILLGIGFIMAGISAKKQALHDMLADTLVMRH